ncbi:MAG: hypothetical protein ABL901_00670 [Hyphomicrobiaceae bacterium]
MPNDIILARLYDLHDAACGRDLSVRIRSADQRHLILNSAVTTERCSTLKVGARAIDLSERRLRRLEALIVAIVAP